MTDLTCSTARDSISARIDGEITEENERFLDAHVASCPACNHYQTYAYDLRRSLRMQLVPSPTSEPATIPDPASQAIGSLKGVNFLRYVLFVIGATLIVFNVPSILSPDSDLASHLGRHDGVFGTALGIGMLAVAARPHRAIGLVPITSAVALLMLVVATADLVAGNANLIAEAIHVLQFAGLICLWLISGGPSRLPRYFSAIAQWSPRSLSISN